MNATAVPSGGADRSRADRRRGRLAEYDRKRAFDRTPEPPGGKVPPEGVPEKVPEAGRARFVVQEHHARRLHWDLRLEHDGVLVSWALPRGFPDTPDENRLAVHTEDHPLEYLDFAGEIPQGEYGGGNMWIWDRGTFTAKEFTDRKVVVELRGDRVRGRYALFATDDKNWLIHRMDPPDPDREPMPRDIAPMKAVPSSLPERPEEWAFELKWDGIRALAYAEPGRIRLINRTGREVTAQYPEIFPLARQIGARHLVLDGELVAFDDNGLPSFERLQSRMHVSSEAQARRRARDVPVTYVIFDLLYLDGRLLLDRPYEERRAELDALKLSGPNWQTPSRQHGDGHALLKATRTRGLEGIVAKRLGSTYQPGRRSADWLKIKNVRTQDVVIGGWVPGRGRRAGAIGALIVGYYEYDDRGAHLRYAGKVGTGFGAAELAALKERLEPLHRGDSPFEGRQPQRDTVFVTPELVCEVAFTEWTSSSTLRHPSFRRLREDKPATEAVREDAPQPEPVGKPADLIYPLSGFTAGDLLGYYRAVAPALLAHLAGRTVQCWRYPEGVSGPREVETVAMPTRPKRSDLERLANRHAVELRPSLARDSVPERPTMVVFGIGTDAGADLSASAAATLWLREIFDSLGLECVPLYGGANGLQLRVPLNGGSGIDPERDVDFDRTEPLAHAIAALVEQQHPDRVATRRVRRRRGGPVHIEWRQRAAEVVPLAPFSLCAEPRPEVVVPLRWDEVEAAAATSDTATFRATPDEVVAELAERKALCGPLLELRQDLPTLG